ncbi:MAG: elongation factor P [Terriglobia bacterium]
MITPTQFKVGMTINQGGSLFSVLSFQHVKPGKGHAFVRCKLKNLDSGAVIDKNFRPDEKIESAHLDHRKMQYLYRDGDQLVFMDTTSFEQISLAEHQMGDGAVYLKEEVTVDVSLHQGNPVSVELPIFVELKVAETVPGVKGDTATGGNKPAKMETGATVQVPLFVDEGDIIKIDTRTGKYVTRL